jgi:hypothetical protein
MALKIGFRHAALTHCYIYLWSLKMRKNQFTQIFLTTLALTLSSGIPLASAADADKKAAPVDVCALPTAPAKTQEETAWQLFVAINCKINNNQLTWETWKTQACLNNPDDCPTERLQGSLLRNALVKTDTPDKPKRTGGCEPMTTATSAKGTGLEKFVPKNLSSNPVFCEEVTINAAEETYGNTNGLLTVAGQMTYLKSGATINFPTAAVEVKADWVSASSYSGVKFDCKSKKSTVYQEMIGGQCYALVGMHISSKLYPNWLWATFEPQDKRTNPNRCNPSLYNACVDTWGSKPAKSTGADTKTTPALQALFNAAGSRLDKSFQNYRLTGTQTQFDQPTTSNGNLGNSFVEFNAQVPPQQASCITCHYYAQRSITTGQTPPGSAPAGSANVGQPTPLSADFKPLDFSWFLGFGVPQK